MRKVAYLKKRANVGDWPGTAAAAVLAFLFLSSAAGGATMSKFTEPSEHDLNNLKKEYELARLHRDNQTQQILSAREDAERQMRGTQPKAMRIG